MGEIDGAEPLTTVGAGTDVTGDEIGAFPGLGRTEVWAGRDGAGMSVAVGSATGGSRAGGGAGTDGVTVPKTSEEDGMIVVGSVSGDDVIGTEVNVGGPVISIVEDKSPVFVLFVGAVSAGSSVDDGDRPLGSEWFDEGADGSWAKTWLVLGVTIDSDVAAGELLVDTGAE